MEDCLLSTKEYASEHGVTQRTVQRWIEQGLIFAVRIGRGFKIACDEPDPQDLGSFPEPEYPKEEPVKPLTDDEGYPKEEPTEEEEEEEEPEDICGGDTPEGIEIHHSTFFPRSDLRKSFSTYDEAVDYASEIPCPTQVFRRAEDCFYQVLVECSP